MADDAQREDEPKQGDWLSGTALIWSVLAIAIAFGVVIAALHRAGLE
jgi:hypothetical protein